MIPKVIHYCWFGNGKKSALIKRCIKSWHKICPDYEIREWNESNFDINICPYVKQAYEQKKWAFVSDYARFYILKKYGGIYLDVDVELMKPLDPLLKNNAFAGFASDSIVATGLVFACEKDNQFAAEILKSYEGQNFINDDPSKILAIGRRVTQILNEHGLELNGKQQTIFGVTVYPVYYFNPTNGDIHAKVDPRAYSVHHYAATWFPKNKRILNTLRRFIGSANMERYYKIKRKVTGRK